MKNRRIVLKVEFGYSDSSFDDGADLTDAELKRLAVDDFIEEITRLCEREDLRDYVYASINKGAFTLNKRQKLSTG